MDQNVYSYPSLLTIWSAAVWWLSWPTSPDVPKKWKSPKEMFERALEHERKITQRIDALCQTAMSMGDLTNQ